ncbi:MAG TPA: YfhO family protein, partial [Blastocatellia bacterium]|nr:YfhO family protein [Blastocatellia bacterium]
MKAESKIGQKAVTERPHPIHTPFKQAAFKHHAANVGLIALMTAALFWRVFFLGETLIDVATLNNQLPWGYHAAPSDYPYNRRDLTDMYVTRDYFVVSAYGDGELPLWNPYTMAGHPIYADGVTRTLSPFLLFYKFFDVPLGYSLARIIELLLAAVFMYLFLVAIGVSANGGLTGALVFAFSAHSMLHLTGLGWWGGMMWLPLIFLFADRAIARGSYRQAMLAGVMLAPQFFCGYMPNQIYYVGAVVLYYLFFAFVARWRTHKPGGGRALAMMAVTLAVGLALSATQWVPMLELLKHSNRKVVGAELGYIYLPPWYALTLFFPNLFGGAYDTDTLTLFTALGVSHDHILYLGVAALLPLGFSIYRLKRAKSPRVIFFALLAALSLVIMMAAPLYVPITRYIPILQVIRVAVRAGVLFLFAACALVAFGSDLLLESGAGALSRFCHLARRFLYSAIAFVIFAIFASHLMKATGFAVETGERGKLAFIRRAASVLSEQFMRLDWGILLPLIFAGAVVLLLAASIKGMVSRRAFFAGLIMLLIADLFWNGAQFNHSFERSGVYPPTQVTDTLRSLPPGRVLVVPSELETNRRVSSGTDKIIAPPNTLLPYQIPTVSGKNQQFPKWYREYASLVEPQQNLSHVVFDEPRSPFFDLLNVRYVMTRDSSPPIDGYNLIARAEGVAVYENSNALPRAFFADRVVEVFDHADALNALREPGFDVRTVVVETGRDAGVKGAMAEGSLQQPETTGRNPAPGATIVEDKRNRVAVETDSPYEGMLVLSDNYYPGWRASVDGSPVEIFRANCTMRAVKVPAGRHVVSFVFMPTTFWSSAYISFAS